MRQTPKFPTIDDMIRFDLEDYQDLDTSYTLNILMIMNDPGAIHEVYFGRLDVVMLGTIETYKDRWRLHEIND